MCFSASASLSASALLAGVGALTVYKAEKSRELPYAAIPFLFALQQGTEGLLWLGFGWGTDTLNFFLTQLYSLFSHVLWPVYVPMAVWLLEPAGPRRNALGWVSAAGILVGSYLLYTLFAYPLHAHPVGGHIEYDSPHFYIVMVMALYLTATILSLILSSHGAVKCFGALALISAAAAYFFYQRWYISVWCFFAALVSVTVYLYFTLPRGRDSVVALAADPRGRTGSTREE